MMAIAILEAALRSSALIVLVWLLLRVLRIRSPSVERTAWLTVLVASSAIPLAMSIDALPASVVPAVVWLPAAEISAISAGTSSEWQRLLFLIYVGVAGVLCSRQAFGLWRLWRLRGSALPCVALSDGALDIRMSSEVSSPATIFSTILVPIDFPTWRAPERAAALAHEHAHVANKDFYVQTLAHLHRHLFWFNPLAWWLPRRLSLVSEHVSDDAALAALGERVAYAELLLGCASKAAHHEQALPIAKKATLAQRIERILDTRVDFGRAARWKHVAITAVLLPIAALSATLQTDPETRTDLRLAALDTSAPNAGAAPVTRRMMTAPKSNPARPLSQPAYPPLSVQLRETGTVVLRLLVLEDGSVGDAVIAQSSGHPNLDYSAMYESFRWQLDPGTVNGQPQRMWGQFAVTFKLPY